MINVHLFGVTTPTGKYLENKFLKEKSFKFYGYSRTNSDYNYINFKDNYIELKSNKNIFICCAPIWEFSKFIGNIYKNNKKILYKINCFIICSSTSIVTKRFAINNFDKELVKKLESAEKSLIYISKEFKVKCNSISKLY